MDDAVVQRCERYFELIQAQLVGVQEQQTSMQEQLTAMRGEIADVKADLKAHRIETAEQFQSVHDQISTLTQRVEYFHARTGQEMEAIRKAMPLITERMASVEDGMTALNGRIDVLSDEMRQRFRGVK